MSQSDRDADVGFPTAVSPSAPSAGSGPSGEAASQSQGHIQDLEIALSEALLLAQTQQQLNNTLVIAEQKTQQALQQAQLLNRSLQERLQAAQTRIAELERREALARHQLSQCEQTCQSLESRLHHQLRQSAQLKAALERCMDAQTAASDPVIQPWSRTPLPAPLVPQPADLPAAPQAALPADPAPASPAPAPDFRSALSPSRSNLDVLRALVGQPLEPLPEPQPQPQPQTQSQPQPQPLAPLPDPEAWRQQAASAANSPSPLLYPNRRTVGPKSMAAVDLPSFPRIPTSPPPAKPQSRPKPKR